MGSRVAVAAAIHCLLALTVSCAPTSAFRGAVGLGSVRTGVIQCDTALEVAHQARIAVDDALRLQFVITLRLAVALGLGPDAELSSCVAAIRLRARAWRELGRTVEILVADRSFPVVASDPALPSGSPVGPTIPDGFPESQAAAEAVVDVTVRIDGEPLPPEQTAVLRAVRDAVRSAAALRRRMDLLVQLSPVVFRAISASRPCLRVPSGRADAVRGAWDEALDVLASAPVRAEAQIRSAQLLALRVQAALRVEEAP